MVAAINSVVAGASVALLGVGIFARADLPVSIPLGIRTAVVSMYLCYTCQRRRYRTRLEHWNAVQARFPLP